MSSARLRAPLALLSLALAACGARTDPASLLGAPQLADAAADTVAEGALDAPADAPADATPDVTYGECASDVDCSARWECELLRCVAHACVSTGKARCDDGDVCTDDRCDRAAQRCTHAPATLDGDGDGHRAPRAGALPGAAGSCGDDCDDGDARVHPGAAEICNGADDDCDGRVDPGMSLRATEAERLVAPPSARDSAISALTPYAGGVAVIFGTHVASTGVGQTAVSLFDATLTRRAADLYLSGSDAFGTGIAWAGDRFGVVWYYLSADNLVASRFALLDDALQRRGPGEIALLDSGFAAGGIFWTGSDFLVSGWSPTGSTEGRWGFDLHALHVSAVGVAGSELALPVARASIGASVAPRPDGGWVALWLDGEPSSTIPEGHLRLAPLDEALGAAGAVREPSPRLFTYASLPIVVGARVYYAASTRSGTIQALAVDPDSGALVASATPFTGSAAIARDPSVAWVDGRLLVAWADDHDDGRSFEIYVQPYTATLAPIGAPIRITNAAGDGRRPWLSAIGGTRDAVVLWDDARDGQRPQAYARRLSCVAQ